ncbi:MAG TPA: acyl-CoA dehydrogenase family protein, partial [Candidatus Binataceae bacterium]|nr:acyl-CoA dehydrogenase family protein [Candidatus Binataceae bacterium]
KEAGFYRLVAPTQYGGLGAGVLGWVVAAEELAQGCPSTAVSFNMHVATLATYLMKANFAESYKQRLANEIVRPDKLLAAILSEPGTTGLLPSTFACATQARKVDGGWRLNGKKGFCTMAQSADVINIFAHPEDSTDPETALSFLISPKLKGIRVENNWNTLGMRATKSDNLVLEDVFVPEDALYCLIPNAGIFVSESEPLYNLPYTAVYLGIAVGALEAAKQAVHQRLPRGYRQSLAYHPDVRRRIAQASAQVDAARLMVRNCAWYLDREGQSPAVTASYFKTKYFVGETVAAVTRSCLEMAGAHALFKGGKLELLFRDGVTATIHHPPSDYCLSETSIYELGLDRNKAQPPIPRGWN